MSYKLVKNVILSSVLLSLTACTQLGSGSTQAELDSKEALYYNTHNYNNLISLYRKMLKEQDKPELRYKLAEVYYKIGDIKSSQLYLRPLLTSRISNDLSVKAYLLQIKNSIKLKHYPEAVGLARDLQNSNPKLAEVYLLKGQAYALMGNYEQAKTNFDKSRELFINETVALNDLAVLAILEKKYQDAVEILLPAYQNGLADSRMMHNLVFALVKNNQEKLAKEIVEREGLNTSPGDLIEALKKTSRTQ